MRILLTAIFVFIFAFGCQAQTSINPNSKKPITVAATVSAVKASPAYAEILLRKTERESELEELLLDYKEEFPKVKELRFEVGLLQKELDKILTVNTAESGKLTLALGKLLVRKIEIETDLWNLQQQYNADHPEVKRARRKIAIYERAIKEIL